MYDLYLKSDGRFLGTISDEEMQFLQDNLEEESLTDDDYTISPLTLEYLRGNGMSPHLAQLLEQALGDQDEVDIQYRPHTA
jgi:hypothetical protein